MSRCAAAWKRGGRRRKREAEPHEEDQIHEARESAPGRCFTLTGRLSADIVRASDFMGRQEDSDERFFISVCSCAWSCVFCVGRHGFGSGAACAHCVGASALERSLANRTIIETVRRELPDAEIIDLGQMYPNYTFDVPREQERVRNADIIVMQYPAYWYAAPALMKKWQEDVLTFGFAHNAEGGLLGGRTLIVSVTSGAPESDYAPGARMNRPMEEYQYPVMQMAALSGIDFGGMVYSGGYRVTADASEHDALVRHAEEHGMRLVAAIRQAAETRC